MLKQKRQMQILELLHRDGEVTVSGLSRSFGVAEMTIRRDLRASAQEAAQYASAAARCPAACLPTIFGRIGKPKTPYWPATTANMQLQKSTIMHP